MPTGYTAGIVDGTTKDFESYAKLCMRNFGAMIHMRDSPLEPEIQFREPSRYHEDNIARLEFELERWQKSSDEDIMRVATNELKALIRNQKTAIIEKRISCTRLHLFLDEAKLFEAPTEDHVHFVNFMVSQLEETINHDCDTSYNEERISELLQQLKFLHAVPYREQKISQIQADITYHKTELEKEIERCEKANLWIKQVLQSL